MEKKRWIKVSFGYVRLSLTHLPLLLIIGRGLRRNSPLPSNRNSIEKVQYSKQTVWGQFRFKPERTKGDIRHESLTSDMGNLHFFGGGFFAFFKARMSTLMDMLLSISTDHQKSRGGGYVKSHWFWQLESHERSLSKKIISLACEGKGEGSVIRKEAGIVSSDYFV